MQAVIAICHFCETHGPRVLATCQPMREHDAETMDVEAANSRWSAGSPDSGEGDIAASSDGSSRKRFYGNPSLILRHAPTNGTMEDGKCDSSRSQDGEDRSEADEERCAACTSFGGWQPGFLTNDHDARTSYVSSQFPYHKRVCAVVRQAGLRSLSCEIAPGPGRDGAVFFGDEANGFTLSYSFTLRDAKARGFQHWYSLIIVSMDKLLLLNSYDFFVTCLKAVVDKLQVKANSVFEMEQKEPSNDGDLRPTMASRAKELPPGFLKYRAGSIDSSRSLVTLTGDKDIFRRLHRYFVWIMKMQSLRFVEVLLEGCPTQDMLVEMERSAENPEVPEIDDFLISDQLHDCPVWMSYPSDDEANEEGEVVPAHLQAVADFKAISRGLSREDFTSIVRQIVTGEQLVVVSNRSPLSRRILLAFAVLLPRGCVRLVSHGAFYLELYRCNLLGLSRAVELPPDLGEVMIVDVCEQSDKVHDLTTCTLRISQCPQFTSPPPTLVARIEQLVLNEELPCPVLEAVLRSTREEWLNKAKLVYQLTKQNQDVDMKKLMNVVKCSDCDMPVVYFWQAGLSKQYKQYVLNVCSRFHQQNEASS
uniref:Folliculin n=1 Tax=Plectus sambesii TaxID=2011161 RepID=A0A914X0C7_9BILA